MYMEQSYYTINVIGKNGYSFVVHGYIKHEEDAIQQALDNDLFNDELDAEQAMAEEAVPTEVRHFEECGCVYEV